MEALARVPADLHILACPEDAAAGFAPLAEEAAFIVSTGPKDDVLARYCAAIRRFKPERIIRATGDNPFVFADAAWAIHQEAQALDADYAGYQELPYGAGVESVKADALLRAEREAVLPVEREHVCPYLYGHAELFQLHRPPAPPVWRAPGIRLTVDTPEDYRRAQALWSAQGAWALWSAQEAPIPGGFFPGEAIIAAYGRLWPATERSLP
jgi:spore coat polysaccharide biosynthesis protein SpsF